jgi:hypothetical protein
MVKFNEWQPGDPPLSIEDGWTNTEVYVVATAAMVVGIIIGYCL